MKVLLIGELFSSNLGDQIIYLITRRVLETMYPEVEIVLLDIMGRQPICKEIMEEKCENLYELYVPLSMQLSKISFIDCLIKTKSAYGLREYYKTTISKDIDLAVFTGGALIQDTFAIYLRMIISILDKNNIPIVFNGVGVGTQSKITQYNLQKMLYSPNIKAFSCRCLPKRFDNMNINNGIIPVSSFDIAVLASDFFPKCDKKHDNVVGLGVMNSSRFPLEELISFWINIIKELQQRGIMWKIFTTGSRNDDALALEILKRLKLPRENACFPKTVEELVDIITSFERLISFRLHSHIISYSYNIPSVGIWWDSKIEDFFEKTNRTDSLFEISTAPSVIINKLLEIEQNKKGVSDKKKETLMCFKKNIDMGLAP